MKKNNLILILLLFAIMSCQEDKIETFNLDEDKIYFQLQSFSGANGAEGYSTSTKYSFVGRDQSVTQVVFRGSVKLMGNIKDYDRSIRVVIDKENSTMSEDGYEINTDTLKIKAGANSVNVNVRFNRTMDLRTSSDTLVLKLENNEHFTVLQEYKSSNDWSNTTATTIDGSRYTFVIDEIYRRPDSWHGGSPLYVTNYFGDWNPTRFIFINGFFGFSLDDWVWVNGPTSKLSIGRMGFYAKQLQAELQRRADIGEPVKDEDGSNMQLPAPYIVDYSKN